MSLTLDGASPPENTEIAIQDMGMVREMAMQHRRAGSGCGAEIAAPFSLACKVILSHRSLEKGDPEVT